ncbi:hypothetical protein [Embleya sp. NBC_00896]|uniref:hypothetical protein n=1 Tax=Embleya sp. NBC_00896 TaxID=2975961 RepID=UPI002F9188EA|nr:hypothetical protein OG928_33190 [Embleya sp. NBC_00896]
MTTDDASVHATDSARRYYDTDEVDACHAAVLAARTSTQRVYAHRHESIAAACRRAVERTAARSRDLLGPSPGCRRRIARLSYGRARYVAVFNVSGCR